MKEPPEKSWKNFAREILTEVYRQELKNYTVRGQSGKQKIAPELLIGIHSEQFSLFTLINFKPKQKW